MNEEESGERSYRGALLAIAGAAAVAAAALAVGGLLLGNAVPMLVSASLGVASACVIGVVGAHGTSRETPLPFAATRQRLSALAERAARLRPRFKRRTQDVSVPEPALMGSMNAFPEAEPPDVEEEPGSRSRLAIAIFATFATICVLVIVGLPEYAPPLWPAAAGTAACLVAAALALVAVRYFDQIDATELPEAAPLARGGRVVMWLFVVAAMAVAAQWASIGASATILRTLGVIVAALNVAASYALVTAPDRTLASTAFDVDFTFARVLGSRTNLFASIMDTAQSQLGVDLRSTWALEVVRQALEPLALTLALLAWLTTSFTIVGVDEQGLVERLGVARSTTPLEPGLHAHLPWPIDRVYRLPAKRMQALSVGHEGEEEGGPENVLWAVEHAKNEYTLLLGNGRDLITIDAGVQYRIVDARAWFYHAQNPEDALRAIAYRAVMRNTVNRTLEEALSENLVATTARMRAMVQEDADALGLGVQVVNFTVGGMHPPVAVAADYQRVVSAELGKVTSIVNAQTTRNRTVPYAESEVLVGANVARAEGAETRARAAGDAWAFRAIEAQYRTSPAEYQYRQRLEALERVLTGRRYTILDERIQRDRGELWITP